MTQLRLETFRHLEGPVEAFLDLPRRLQGLTAEQAAAEVAGTRALLDDRNTFHRSAESVSFLALRGERPVGRVTAFHHPLLVEGERSIGLVGLFECENDPETALRLLDTAAGWLRERGAWAVRGPMAGDIWHRWRFMTKGFDTLPFPGEPRQPEHYPELFMACGFAPVRTYATKLIGDLEAQLERFRAAEVLNRRRGYTFRSFDPARWEEEVHHLYLLCQHAFASNWCVTPTTEEEFADIYNRWLRRVGPGQIVLAEEGSGQVVGLGLAVSSAGDTINLRTVAVLPEHGGCGLGQAICAELYRRALEQGMAQAHHCLMGPQTPPQRWDRGHGRVTRLYTMYERGLG